jgi:hypothetical protein
MDVDPGFFAEHEEHLRRATNLLARLKLDWPNAIVPNGFKDTMRSFNLSGYGNIIVDAAGIVRGVDLHGEDLQHLLDELVKGKKIEKAGK